MTMMNYHKLVCVWQQVERAYMDERINSERALQAIMYNALTAALPSDYLVLVEAGFPSNQELSKYISDLMVLNRRTKTVEGFFELKCAPHCWLTKNNVRRDLDKLQAYSGTVGSAMEIDVFGPKRIFDNGVWIGGRPRYLVANDAIVAFVLLARRNDMLHREKLSHAIIAQQNFMLFSGCTEPGTEEFLVQVVKVNPK